MANAKQCDRCSKFYKENDCGTFGGSFVKGILYIRPNGGTTGYVDLCTECTECIEDIKRFLDGFEVSENQIYSK